MMRTENIFHLSQQQGDHARMGDGHGDLLLPETVGKETSYMITYYYYPLLTPRSPAALLIHLLPRPEEEKNRYE